MLIRDRTPTPKLKSGARRDLLIGSGVDCSGPVTVAGIELELVDHAEGLIQSAIPSIIEGFPLASARPVFEAAAIVLAIRDRSESWDGLRWLCLLNEADPDDTAISLRSLSEQVRTRIPEPGVHPDLPKRIAALLLWLTGHEEDDEAAASINPGLARPASYEEDYLPQPSRSIWFPLERRHADLVFKDPELSSLGRVNQVNELWLDPHFEPPDSFVQEICKMASGIMAENLHPYAGHSAEIHEFDQLEPVLARCAPGLLANLVRRKCEALVHLHLSPVTGTPPMQPITWCWPVKPKRRQHEHFAVVVVKMTRQTNTSPPYRLLLLEIRDLGAQDQFDTLMDAGLRIFSLVLPKSCAVRHQPK